MLNKSLVVAAGLLSLASATAHSEGAYYGGNLSFLDYSEDIIDDSASLTAIYGRLGTTFNENFSGEFRVGVGVGGDTVDVSGTDVGVELDSMFGAYVRGGIPVSENFFPYVVLGYTRGEVTVSASGFGSYSESETDTSFGLGADINVNSQFTINVEYMNYFDKDGAEIDGFSVGIASKF